jgi:RNA polymerase sigma-70 factor (ECF subfamily)
MWGVGDVTKPLRGLNVPRVARRFGPVHLRDLADADLIDRVQDGEVSAFEVIVDRHADAAYSLAYRVCGRPVMAEDAVQDAFVSLWRARHRYDRARGSVGAWVLSAVRNRTLDALRRERVKAGKDVNDEAAAERLPGTEQTEAEAQRREEGRQIRHALDGLPSEQRQVIELAYFGGLSHSEIARKLSLPPGTVKGRMRLGLSRMRGLLADCWAVAL